MRTIRQLTDRFGLAMILALLPEEYDRPQLPPKLPQSRRGPVYDDLRTITVEFYEATRRACENGTYTRNWYSTDGPMPADVSFAMVVSEAARMSDELSNLFAEPGQGMWPEVQYTLSALLSYLLATAGVNETEALVQRAKLRTSATLASLLNDPQ